MEKSIKNIGKSLMKADDFKRVCDITKYEVPEESGFYAIAINDAYDIEQPFCDELIERKHNLLYIGITKKGRTLRERLWEEELHSIRYGTLFRSIGAIKGFRPPKGTLSPKRSTYKFSKEDTESIIEWINEHIKVNYIISSLETADMKLIEQQLIHEYKPLLNIMHNPYKLKKLMELREECISIAREK